LLVLALEQLEAGSFVEVAFPLRLVLLRPALLPGSIEGECCNFRRDPSIRLSILLTNIGKSLLRISHKAHSY